MTRTVLVTGGAGYIGSHAVLHLLEAGHEVVVLDNLCAGHREAVTEGAVFYQASIDDREAVSRILSRHKVDSVLHFAAHVVVPESVSNPYKYYRNNVTGSLSLIQSCIENHVNQFVFSSSAAVYGIPRELPAREDSPVEPINPYGTTKLMTEWSLRDLAQATRCRFRYVALRYFNVAGAHMGGQLGQNTPQATHLVKVACQAACDTRKVFSVFGEDYDTPDGTCIRDFIHVDDLAGAHLEALAYLQSGGESTVVNCGYGQGYSVREVVECVRQVSGSDFPVTTVGRRAGDPPELVADTSRIGTLFGWTPKYNSLEEICRSAYRWESRTGGDSAEYP